MNQNMPEQETVLDVGIRLLQNLYAVVSGTAVRIQANTHIRKAVIEAIANQFNWPVASIERILHDPASDKQKWEQIATALADCRVSFKKSMDNKVDVSICLQWNDSESTTIRQRWAITQIPPEVRQALDEREQVSVQWQMPEIENALHQEE